MKTSELQTRRLLTRTDLSPLPRRPGERFEPWSVASPELFVEVAQAAQLRNLPLSLAMAVSCERELLLIDLEEVSVDPESLLDRKAAQDRCSFPGSGSWGYYLRVLSGAEACNFDADLPIRSVNLPIRILDRLDRHPPPRRLDGQDLVSALAWEAAAAASRLTMTEWAYRSVLTSAVSGVPEEIVPRNARV